jgi:antirestriction protein ArdC
LGKRNGIEANGEEKNHCTRDGEANRPGGYTMLSQAEIRANITNRIVEALKKGIIPWRKPWSTIPDPVRLPTNFVTGKAYQGLNVQLLWLTQHERGYPVSLWASFNQFRNRGVRIKKGEKATQIVFWKPIKKVRKDENGDEYESSFPLLRTWSIFNVAQAEGEAVEKFHQEPEVLTFDDVDRSEFDRAVAATQAEIKYGFNQAAYLRPPGDYITMPDEGRFHSFSAFAETLLHEIAHWSEWRTGWKGSYAEGELRAEIAACYLATALGIQNSDDLTNHASYVQSWLRALDDDPKFIFRAASAASKATDFVLSFSRPQEVEGTEADQEAEAIVAQA